MYRSQSFMTPTTRKSKIGSKTAMKNINYADTVDHADTVETNRGTNF